MTFLPVVSQETLIEYLKSIKPGSDLFSINNIKEHNPQIALAILSFVYRVSKFFPNLNQVDLTKLSDCIIIGCSDIYNLLDWQAEINILGDKKDSP